MSAGAHLAAALAAEHEALRGALAGEADDAAFAAARDAYLASHAETGPQSWGRLIGALKMAILAGDGAPAIARQAVEETGGADGSAAAAYAAALAQVVLGGRPNVEAMVAAGGAFERTGRALAALADGDGMAYATALGAIVADFEGRDQHLSGVAVADTALVLERLAEPRGMAVHPVSSVVPRA